MSSSRAVGPRVRRQICQMCASDELQLRADEYTCDACGHQWKPTPTFDENVGIAEELGLWDLVDKTLSTDWLSSAQIFEHINRDSPQTGETLTALYVDREGYTHLQLIGNVLGQLLKRKEVEAKQIRGTWHWRRA